MRKYDFSRFKWREEQTLEHFINRSNFGAKFLVSASSKIGHEHTPEGSAGVQQSLIAVINLLDRSETVPWFFSRSVVIIIGLLSVLVCKIFRNRSEKVS